ncbi:MAG: GH32 C-terminal domain-containing protein [Rikenellaceae bacterium]|nr:GH32 C-terminal domain-containing protein [Rikenellaceae bacterium]
MYVCLLAVILSGCRRGDITIADFEGGTYEGWAVEGEAFGAAPSHGAEGVQNEVTGFDGRYLANSFAGGGDDPTGTLTSDEFSIRRRHINFLLGGGTGCRAELLVDGVPVRTARPHTDGEALVMRSWDVTELEGSRARIRIVDDRRGGWGHILADRFEMSDRSKSDILADYRLDITVGKDLVLIPVEDSAPPVRVDILHDGIAVGPGMDIRLAHGDADYYVPVDVSACKGEGVTLRFDYIPKNSSLPEKIVQADAHDFDYSERFRPNYHFSPRRGWMNDPNGMVYHHGEYHLFFQHNPYGSTWGNMTWGHAVSKDLRRWEYLPDAILPDTLGTIFSGSAVVDKDNTAGFGHGAIVAVYTSEGKRQTQCIAYSLDNGRTFTKYEGNPVLSSDIYSDFRDPKVRWHEASSRWIMSLAAGQVIGFYSSPDLKEWTLESEFGREIGSHGGVWECPDLIPMDYNGKTKWVLLVSINPGGPNGGSATQYFIGDFDGRIFTADDLPYPLWLDYGRDNYAGVTWSDAPGGRNIFIGWMNNWDYANEVPTLNFRSSMTVPRELSLIHNGSHLAVVSNPASELLKMRGRSTPLPDTKVSGGKRINLAVNGSGYEMEMEIFPAGADTFSFSLVNTKEERIDFEFNLREGKLLVDRSKSGDCSFSPSFAGRPIEAPLVRKDIYNVRLVVDTCSTELFVNDGQTVTTNTVYPSEPWSEIEFTSAGGSATFKNILIHTLK